MTIWSVFLVGGLSAVPLMFAVLLSLIARRDSARRHAELVRAFENAQAEIQELRAAIDQTQAALIEMRSAPPPSPAALNLSRRAQILRLARRGEGVPQIAAAVGVPRNEVELLLKITPWRDSLPAPRQEPIPIAPPPPA